MTSPPCAEKGDFCLHPRLHFASQASIIHAGAKSSRPLKYTSFGAACSEVEVDLLTGEKTILRSDLYFDCGRSLNPAVDIGQVIHTAHCMSRVDFHKLHMHSD